MNLWWRLSSWMLVAATVVGLPVVGLWLAGLPRRHLLVFPPPLQIPTDYPRFSWWAAGAIIGALFVVIAAWQYGVHARRQPPPPHPPIATARRQATAFPWWGWLAAAWTVAWWGIAWTRLDAFAPVQRYTFFPLWLGFIVLVNAGTTARLGTCLMHRAPGRWFGLFGLSGLFWWIFEWLNRFVRNWHYLGVQEFGSVEYAVHATLCFSTVLPAVAGVAELLSSLAGWRAIGHRGPRWRWASRRSTAGVLTLAGATALLLTGVYPQYLYPSLWSAPLALLWARAVVCDPSVVPREVAQGDWRRPLTWMAAALVCGGFWELWNVHSVAQWIYTVPGVERWFLFEMPLLGYTGYLPFGLQCLLVAEWLIGREAPG